MTQIHYDYAIDRDGGIYGLGDQWQALEALKALESIHYLNREDIRRQLGLDDTTPEEREMGSFHNTDAQELARELLSDKNKSQLRERVESAIAGLQDLIAETECGSTLTFKKTNDKGQHYFYAAVKNGGKWYTTAQNPRALENDDQLIEWLIGLEIWGAPMLEVSHNRHELGAGDPIEATATES